MGWKEAKIICDVALTAWILIVFFLFCCLFSLIHEKHFCRKVPLLHHIWLGWTKFLLPLNWCLSQVCSTCSIFQHLTLYWLLLILFQGDIATCAGVYLYLWSINGDLIASVNTSTGRDQQILCCAMSEVSCCYSSVRAKSAESMTHGIMLMVVPRNFSLVTESCCESISTYQL